MISGLLICLIFVSNAVGPLSGHDTGTAQHVQNAESGGHHDTSFDHQAFLGADQAAEFDKLKPDESKARLKKMLPKIDKNNDTFITVDELKVHIAHMANKYIDDDVKRTWGYHPKGDNDKLDWKRYKRSMTGVEDDAVVPTEYREILIRDEPRWKTADLDKDDQLDYDEYRCFQHPEDCKHMRDVMINEHLRLYDKDKDGFVSFKEYVSDVFHATEEELKNEPDWMKGERETFMTYRDHNKDGRLDRSEVGEWLWPADYDHVGIEANHLVKSADDSQDGKLTFDEILEHFDVFVGSQATQYGEHLKKHDPAEL